MDFHSLLDANLACQPDERLAIVTDDAPLNPGTDEVPTRVALAEAIATAARERGIEVTVVTYPGGQESGAEPPLHVFEAVYPTGFADFLRANQLEKPLLEKRLTTEQLAQIETNLVGTRAACDVLLVLSASSISHTNFRGLLTRTKLIRAATMPGVELDMFEGVMTADWPLVERRSLAVAKGLTAADTAIVRSAGGRELRFSLAGREALADTGIINQVGQFGNLPGGEGFIAPVEGTAEGELSVGPPEDPGRWWFRFAGGQLVEVQGDPPFAATLDAVFAEHPSARNLAELGVGTNERAKPCDSILESEKILGTVHLAMGDNASFGGNVSVPYHQDFIVYGPTLVLESASGETKLVDEGTLTVG